MNKNPRTLQQFITSLNALQRDFFLQREAEIQNRLQSSLREFGRGMSELSALNGEALAVALDARGESSPSRRRAR